MSLIDDFIESTEPGGSSTLANYNGHAGAGGLYSNDYPNDDMVRVSLQTLSWAFAPKQHYLSRQSIPYRWKLALCRRV